MKINDRKQLVRALYQVLEKADKDEQTKLLNNFVEFLQKKHCLKQAGQIIDEFEIFAKKQQGIKSVEIWSVSSLDKNMLEKIKNIFGKKVETVEKINPGLLGGLIIKVEDKILDGSIKKQLKTLKNKLN
jgi:F-type H+-transporting ATPase subunit delta